MENVDRFIKSNAHNIAIRIFKSAGYGLTEEILDASFCGVPQRRKRYFCIGHRLAKDGFIHEIISQHILKKEMTVREYLGNELGIEHYYRHPRNYNRRGIYSIDEPSPTVRGVNRPVPKGYKGHSGDPIPISADLRPLTTMERARIQTFPEEFHWNYISKTDLEQLIGNSVPVNLAQFVARMLKIYIQQSKKRRDSNG
jgi:DNA (cytosine-5)-methyltransferase 1